MSPSLDKATLLAISTECACFNLRRASRAVTQLYDQTLGESGLRATQVSLLVALARAGAIPSSRLAEILGMDPTTLSRNLAPLRRAKLLTFTVGRPDRRVKLVALSANGEKTLAAAIPHWKAAQRRLTEALGLGNWTALRQELGRITTIAGAAS
jgi:DNA-binding MarR family transcriptional regulator